MAGMTTLRCYLSQQKPPVACSMKAGRNAISYKWPKLAPLNPVTIWDDFNLTNRNESYGHILDFAVPESQLLAPEPNQALAGLAINKDDDIKHLISWNDELLWPALKFAQSYLGLYPGTVIRYEYSTADKLFIAKLPNASKNLVDHVIKLDEFPEQNLLVGLGKPSSKWSNRKLAGQLNGTKSKLLWPLAQLASICEVAETRYGYIQTDEELVVCCFSKDREDWKAAIMRIPWSKHSVEVLTTDLALWWLGMLAMSAQYNRAIVAEEDMIKISELDTFFHHEERGWVRRRRYSNFEEPTDPPPTPNYQTDIDGLSNDDLFTLDTANFEPDP
jgi:hypothetical protein